MLTKKGKAFVIGMIFVMVLFTGQFRLALDAIVAPFRDDFREMLYLPRGSTLKIIACGFEAPLADALFIKGMIYYAESLQAKLEDKTTQRAHTFDLFDVITDLSPRFARAYQMGALFLTASGSPEANMDGVRLLEKGVETYRNYATAGTPVVPDSRWLFHILLANTFEVNIQVRHRRANENEKAGEARQRAAQEYRLAAASPGAPQYVIDAAANYESVLSGGANIEKSLEAALSVWQELHQQAEKRGDKDILPDIENRINDLETQVNNIRNTRELEKIMTVAGKEYLAKKGTPAIGAADLLREGLIPGQPITPLDTEENHDQWLALPDGSFKSRMLAKMETDNHMDLLVDAMFSHLRSAQTPPEDPEVLVREGYLETIPTPPLQLLGQTYEYSPKTGLFTNKMPFGPELPPEQH